jgi:hypothetical protein
MKEIKMKFRNKDGSVIEKNIPENLVSNYLMIGWELVKENKPLVKDNKANNSNE